MGLGFRKGRRSFGCSSSTEFIVAFSVVQETRVDGAGRAINLANRVLSTSSSISSCAKRSANCSRWYGDKATALTWSYKICKPRGAALTPTTADTKQLHPFNTTNNGTSTRSSSNRRQKVNTIKSKVVYYSKKYEHEKKRFEKL